MSQATQWRAERSNVSVAVVIDVAHADHGTVARARAADDVARAVESVNMKTRTIEYKCLTDNEKTSLDSFYNAEIVIVDLSVKHQQGPLFYHLGVRHSLGMVSNILIHHSDSQTALDLEMADKLIVLASGMYSLEYQLAENRTMVVENVTRMPIEISLKTVGN